MKKYLLRILPAACLVILFQGCAKLSSMNFPGDEMLSLENGLKIRATYPRVIITASAFQQVLERMSGPKAREPYKSWFSLIKASEDSGTNVNLTALALLYRGTGEKTYLDRFIARIPATGVPSAAELYGLDLLFNEIPDEVKLRVMRRAGENPDGFYYKVIYESNQSATPSWGYHYPIGLAPALAYAGLFAGTLLEATKDPAIHRFNAANYLKIVDQELAPGGPFRTMENRIAGDPSYNSALPGSLGGMYDNFGYDNAEDSLSVLVLNAYRNITGENRHDGFLHDEYRATFYQNMQIPYRFTFHNSNSYCRRAGDESHRMPVIWNTQTTDITQPNAQVAALTATLFQDPRMQYFVKHGVQFDLCGAPYAGLERNLLFYDDRLPEDPPSSNPTAMYFSGPGLVSMRENWSNDALFAVFMAGEGISRRYEDANSFLLGRKADVMVHAGARIRFDPDNEKTHWYHIRSISKNTLKIFDPLESYDIAPDGTIAPLHSGIPLVPSDNMGGQIFETNRSKTDLCYFAPDGDTRNCAIPGIRPTTAYPLGIEEIADIVKFEHVPDRYTYAVGNASAAYSKKVEFFEREFLYLRPDVVVIFDRVKSADPTFRKVWVSHTVDRPVASGTPIALPPPALGAAAVENSRLVTISNERNVTYLDSLLPVANKVVIRGGDTVLVSGALAPGGELSGGPLAELDIPRWLELFAVGAKTSGSVTIQGDAEEGAGISETVIFDGRTQDEVSSRPTSQSAVSLTDTTQNWQIDQWRGFQVLIRAGGVDKTALITGNDGTTLFGDFTASSAWNYVIRRPVANSVKHWKKITRVTSVDLDASHFTISVPHYFDAEDAGGRLHTFAPRTDSKADGYKKRRDIGQWTLNIEATVPRGLDQFLNVLSLKDPGAPRPSVALLQDTEGKASGAWVDQAFVLFANDRASLADLRVSTGNRGAISGLIFDLVPNSDYHVSAASGQLTISTGFHAGSVLRKTSRMGVLSVLITDGQVN